MLPTAVEIVPLPVSALDGQLSGHDVRSGYETSDIRDQPSGTSTLTISGTSAR